MLRATECLKSWNGSFGDEVVLDYEGRHRRRIMMQSAAGTAFLLDLAEVPDMRDGDGLLLSSGVVVKVRAAPEALMEIRCRDALRLARLAWHIGNRHVAAEIGAGVIRVRVDPVIASIASAFGDIRYVTAAFNPESGAYLRHQGDHNHA